MIVWGGVDAGGNINTGGRYDPVSNTWGAATTTTGVPTVRQYQSAVWTGTEMIIWGGYDVATYNDGYRYAP
jgi:N-acetylneuraminic acid mutarotase